MANALLDSKFSAYASRAKVTSVCYEVDEDISHHLEAMEEKLQDVRVLQCSEDGALLIHSVANFYVYVALRERMP